MSNQSVPFHMQDIADHVHILPEGASTPDSTTLGEAAFVDMHAMQTPVSDHSECRVSGEGLSSTARATEDGRIAIALDMKKQLPDLPKVYPPNIQEFAVDEFGWKDVPKMNIVIMIVGSRGDVQPYVALGKLLVVRDGHRVRIATHDTFRSFVQDAGLEFFNIGGDPHDLMSYMVKNPGLIPGMTSLTNGDISRKRKMVADMIDGCWRACYSPDNVTGKTFAADAIISNPPAFGHVHCGEALGIPLHLTFTMPWSPTTAFPHPLVNIKNSNAEGGLSNYLSYAMADLLTWQGVGDLINTFRTHTLGLSPLTLRSGPGLLDRLDIPWTYCMSPSLVGKPHDWKENIDIAGFYFLDLATDYKPSDPLTAFLAAGTPPVYIGFGSVVVDDAERMTSWYLYFSHLQSLTAGGRRFVSETIFSALATTPPIRALVSAGWGGLGGTEIPENVFILGNVPHDWLFSRVSAVVHHGGAGTTAAGLQKGCPTVIVPFFGDQIFWGTMIHKAGAGPAPIPHKKLNAENLREAIQYALSSEAKVAAAKMAEGIKVENGLQAGLESFYKHLPLLNMRCDLDPSRVAVWWSQAHNMKLSAFAAQTLADAHQCDFNMLELHRIGSKEYKVKRHVSDPLTGGVVECLWMATHSLAGLAELFYRPVEGLITSTISFPKGGADLVQSIHEGLHNAPKLYGSEVREQGTAKGIRSGMKEAGKAFVYGTYDGFTDLVREPIKGAKAEGWVGAVKGSGRGLANAGLRPAAGVLGLVVHPVRGAWKSMQKAWARSQEQHQRSTRISDGLQDVSNSTKSDRDKILERWNKMKDSAGESKNNIS